MSKGEERANWANSTCRAKVVWVSQDLVADATDSGRSKMARLSKRKWTLTYGSRPRYRIVIEDFELMADACTLRKHFLYFETMFSCSFVEKNSAEITMSEFPTASGLRILLGYIYNARVDATPENIIDVMEAADFLLMKEESLESFLTSFSRSAISTSNYKGYYTLLQRYDFSLKSRIKSAVYDWMAKIADLIPNDNVRKEIRSQPETKLRDDLSLIPTTTLCSICGDYHPCFDSYIMNAIWDLEMSLPYYTDVFDDWALRSVQNRRPNQASNIEKQKQEIRFKRRRDISCNTQKAPVPRKPKANRKQQRLKFNRF
ncbi:uncharacterized protein [Ptychodera flava]|uniref:uncharacterized protein n=1 Tax=Ptychodera flava TaxID=63121 RepID=UPI00396A611C